MLFQGRNVGVGIRQHCCSSLYKSLELVLSFLLYLPTVFNSLEQSCALASKIWLHWHPFGVPVCAAQLTRPICKAVLCLGEYFLFKKDLIRSDFFYQVTKHNLFIPYKRSRKDWGWSLGCVTKHPLEWRQCLEHLPVGWQELESWLPQGWWRVPGNPWLSEELGLTEFEGNKSLSWWVDRNALSWVSVHHQCLPPKVAFFPLIVPLSLCGNAICSQFAS